MDDLARIRCDLVQAAASGDPAAEMRGVLRDRPALETVFDESMAVGHVLGFYQLQLGEHDGRSVRLHLWEPERVEDTDEADDIHSHIWGFHSHLLAGYISSTTYEVELGDSGPGDLYAVSYSNNRSHRTRTGTCASWWQRATRHMERDEHYGIDGTDFHTSRIGAAGAVTLIVADGSAERTPYVIRERERPSTEEYPFQYLSGDELKKVFQQVLTMLTR
ncbi:hypothetical protein [Actinomadura craniellae]|nr:hypothetical protein [Actinomadura craniellae]